jgi:uncharacterized membrane protein YedE/YeeE
MGTTRPASYRSVPFARLPAVAIMVLVESREGPALPLMVGAVRTPGCATEDVVHPERGVWQAVRWPLLVLVIAGVGIGVGTVLNRTARSESALTVGGPALTVLLPVGLVRLVVVVIVYVVRRQSAHSSK